jgi:hypothetical protein
LQQCVAPAAEISRQHRSSSILPAGRPPPVHHLAPTSQQSSMIIRLSSIQIGILSAVRSSPSPHRSHRRSVHKQHEVVARLALRIVRETLCPGRVPNFQSPRACSSISDTAGCWSAGSRRTMAAMDRSKLFVTWRLVLVVFLVCSCAAPTVCSSRPLGNQYIIFQQRRRLVS